MTSGTLKRFRYDSGPNMTPLVDVVMVILIFLMLAGSFGTTEHFVASSVPIHAKGGGVPPPVVWTPPIIVDVTVSADGDASVFGMLNYESDPERVKTALEAKLWQIRSANAADPDRAETAEVILHPLPGTRWQHLVPMYDAALRADFHKVSFAQTQ